MKVTTTKQQSDIEYPVLAEWKDTGLIVLLHASQQGICIKSGRTANREGDYATDWAESLNPFKGTVTLEND